MLTKNITGDIFIILEYVDDILLARSDEIHIDAFKSYLQQHIGICDLESSRKFLGIELAR